MALIEPKPFVLKDMLMANPTDSFEKQVSAVILTPTVSVQTWQGGTPAATYSDTTPSVWTCQIDYAQDWETTGSLSQYLFDNEGKQITWKFTPIKGRGKTWTVTATIIPGTIGGSVSAFATASVTMPVTGKPVPTAAAA